MFKIDKIFRLYLSLIVRDFGRKRIALDDDELRITLTKIIYNL